MIFKLMMNFKPGDTWETIFLISNTGSSEEKSELNRLLVQLCLD